MPAAAKVVVAPPSEPDRFARRVALVALGLAAACWTGLDMEAVAPAAAMLVAWWPW